MRVEVMMGKPRPEEAPAMAQARMPDAFFELAAHHLPPDRAVGAEGGRPRIDRRLILNVLWFVLVTGCRWEDVPPQMGCTGRAAHNYLRSWEEAGVWDRLHADLLRLLRQAGKPAPPPGLLDAGLVRALRGGGKTRPRPPGPGGKGSKHTPMGGPHRGA